MLSNIVRNAKKSGGGGIVPSDPYFSSVSLLLHMDGANGSTTFTDNSANVKTVTAVDGAQISTTQSCFGGAAAYFDGTGDYLSLSGGMPSGTGTAFTIECWVRPDDIETYRTIIHSINGLGIVLSNRRVRVMRYPQTDIVISPAIITAGTWYHVAVTRDTSNNYKIYVGGTQVASGANAFSVTAATTIGFPIPTHRYFKGYIDDFRATIGVARTITVPTTAFPNS